VGVVGGAPKPENLPSSYQISREKNVTRGKEKGRKILVDGSAVKSSENAGRKAR